MNWKMIIKVVTVMAITIIIVLGMNVSDTQHKDHTRDMTDDFIDQSRTR